MFYFIENFLLYTCNRPETLGAKDREEYKWT